MSRNMTGINKYKTKDGKTVYRVRYSYQGKDVRLPGTYKTVTEAQDARADAIKAAKKGTPANKNNITVKQLIELNCRLHLKNLARNTRYTRNIFFDKHLIPFMGNRKISTLKKFDWLEIIDHLEGKGLRPNSVRDIMQVVQAIFRWGDDNDKCSNPFEKCKLPSKEKVIHTRLDAKTVNYLWSIAHPIERVILSMGAMNGYRKGEMLGLWWEDIDFTNNTIHIQRSWDGYEYSIKTENSRATLGMPPLVAKALKEWRKVNTHFKFVFPGAGGLKPMSPPMPNYYLKQLLKRGSIEHVTVHELRHSCARTLLINGEDMQLVQKYMRHANIGVTVDLYGDLDGGVTVKTAGRMAKIYEDLTDKTTDKKENTGS